MVTVESALFALTSTPSMGPSSVEVTTPFNATPGDPAARMKSEAARNRTTAAVTTAAAKDNFFRIRTPLNQIVRLNMKTGPQAAPLLPSGSSARQAYIGRHREGCWDYTRYCHPELYSSWIIKKRETVRRQVVGHHRCLWTRFTDKRQFFGIRLTP